MYVDTSSRAERVNYHGRLDNSKVHAVFCAFVRAHTHKLAEYNERRDVETQR